MDSLFLLDVVFALGLEILAMNRNIKILVASFSLIILTLPLITFAHDASLQQQLMTDFAYQRLHKKNAHFTAISMASQCKNNRPVYVFMGTNGFKDLSPINKSSLFPVASITKSFVSVVILQLLQEKNIALETPIKQYFPKYPKWGAVTIKQLLNMTSGIPGNNTGEANDVIKQLPTKAFYGYIKPGTLLDLSYQQPLNFKPGSRYEYSNTNYILLGLLIGKLSHQDPIKVISKRIFDKLQLKHTYFPRNNLSSLPGVNKRAIVNGYNFGHRNLSFTKYGQDTTAYALSAANYDGAIVSTPSDINRYLHALYLPGLLLTKAQIMQLTTLISKANGQRFQPKKQPGQVGYGLGILGVYSLEAKQVIYFYQGQLPGYQFIYLYAPKNQMYLTFAVNTNASDINEKDSMSLFSTLNKKICSS